MTLTGSDSNENQSELIQKYFEMTESHAIIHRYKQKHHVYPTINQRGVPWLIAFLI